MSELRAELPGAIVLAAYAPDPELFRRQLLSLMAQTLTRWTCIVSVDGDREPVRRMVAEISGDDPRFQVIGDGTRRGFYGNFEYGLAAVPPDVGWVALSDQDDYWYPSKLATLVPSLDTVTLVAGQVQLREYPSGRDLGRAVRHDTNDVGLTILHNEFTGSASVFRRELLDLALPFPAVSAQTAAHDHWLAVLASAQGGTALLPEVTQDYIQHGGNVFGDPHLGGSRAGVAGALVKLRAMAQRYEGSQSPAALLRTVFWLDVGWRQTMTDTVVRRLGPDALTEEAQRAYSESRRFGAVRRAVRRGVAAGVVSPDFWREYLASWLAGMLVCGRRRARARATAAGEVVVSGEPPADRP